MNTPVTRNEIIGYTITLIIGLATAAATYLAPSHAEETKYHLEHQNASKIEQTTTGILPQSRCITSHP